MRNSRVFQGSLKFQGWAETLEGLNSWLLKFTFPCLFYPWREGIYETLSSFQLFDLCGLHHDWGIHVYYYTCNLSNSCWRSQFSIAKSSFNQYRNCMPSGAQKNSWVDTLPKHTYSMDLKMVDYYLLFIYAYKR